jgi:hypothetical protein
MENRNRFKSGLIFGIAMATTFVLQNLLTTDHLTAKEVIGSIVSALFGAAAGGLVFGWLTGRFSKFVKGTKIETGDGERIVFETPANHFKGIEAVGGKLYLTNRRLVFKSHKFNIQKHLLSLNIADIAEVDPYKTMGITDNGLLVKTINGSTEKFVVQQRAEWINYFTASKGLPITS